MVFVPESKENRSWLRSAGALLLTLGVVAILAIVPPTYRWFLMWFVLVSAAVGIVVAAILHLWNKHRPVKEENVNQKRPLGL